jgi:hypothetical protein
MMPLPMTPVAGTRSPKTQHADCRDSEGNPFQWTQEAAFFVNRVIGDEATSDEETSDEATITSHTIFRPGGW